MIEILKCHGKEPEVDIDKSRDGTVLHYIVCRKCGCGFMRPDADETATMWNAKQERISLEESR